MNHRRNTIQAITAFTRSTYRDINRNLLNGVVTEQAAELIEAVLSLPVSPGTTYRTFWVHDIEGFSQQLKRNKTITFAAFSCTSRQQHIAGKFNGNVKLTIQGKTGRDIAPWSDAPAEQETLYLPGITCRVKTVRVNRFSGKVLSVEAELIEQ